MRSVRVLRVALRRWYVLLLGLAMTVGLVGAVWTLAPIEYRASASVLLIPPTDKPGQNPYLALSGMREITEVLARSMVSDDTVEQLKEKGVAGVYSVDRDLTAAGPIILVMGESASATTAISDRNIVLSVLPARLAELQTQLQIPRKSHITAEAINVATKAQAQWQGTARLVIAAGAVGLALSLALAVGVDNLMTRRKAGRRSRRRQAGHAIPDSRVADPVPLQGHGTADEASPEDERTFDLSEA